MKSYQIKVLVTDANNTRQWQTETVLAKSIKAAIRTLRSKYGIKVQLSPAN